ncbi:unnamed protein product [Rotaria sordida]|uniref:Uncharacterized protein n=3 Tax=Rotaria sordida TaxID=392033 RepID=A0A818Z5Z8_9BILA|nr:unnamed protein product [Rotaria sordida]CAF1165750.1 unnamed protein product [Rotaria sordida]CAF1402529.1 unnamed protein product [Rotaria sordida]CAF3762535.1 unnamed protein product [Rotaria sordida]
MLFQTKEKVRDDDNNSDALSQHETINPINNSNINDQQITRENPAGLSDNENEMELELLAESDTDNKSNCSAPNTNTHRTSATTGSDNMALFSDDENFESDDADSVRSDSVLGEGDGTSQLEPMIFDHPRDTLAAATASSTSITTTNPTPTSNTVTNDRLVLLPSASNTTKSNTQPADLTTATTHLNVPRLNAQTTMASSLFGDSHSRRQITAIAATSISLNHSITVQQQQQTQPTNIMSANITNALLARAFGIIIR